MKRRNVVVWLTVFALVVSLAAMVRTVRADEGDSANTQETGKVILTGNGSVGEAMAQAASGSKIVIRAVCSDEAKAKSGWNIGGLCVDGTWEAQEKYWIVLDHDPVAGETIRAEYYVDEVLKYAAETYESSEIKVNIYNGFDVKDVSIVEPPKPEGTVILTSNGSVGEAMAKAAAGSKLIVRAVCYDGTMANDGWNIGGLSVDGSWVAEEKYRIVLDHDPVTGELVRAEFSVDEVLKYATETYGSSEILVSLCNGFNVKDVAIVEPAKPDEPTEPATPDIPDPEGTVILTGNGDITEEVKAAASGSKIVIRAICGSENASAGWEIGGLFFEGTWATEKIYMIKIADNAVAGDLIRIEYPVDELRTFVENNYGSAPIFVNIYNGFMVHDVAIIEPAKPEEPVIPEIPDPEGTVILTDNGWISEALAKAAPGSKLIVRTVCNEVKANTGWDIGGLCVDGTWTVDDKYKIVLEKTPAVGDLICAEFSVDEVLEGAAALGSDKIMVNIYNGFSVHDVAIVEPVVTVEKPVTFTVMFEVNGGSEVASQTVKASETAVKPEAPTKKTFELAGWYEDKDFAKEYDFSKPVTSDITLYAKWTKVYKILASGVNATDPNEAGANSGNGNATENGSGSGNGNAADNGNSGEGGNNNGSNDNLGKNENTVAQDAESLVYVLDDEDAEQESSDAFDKMLVDGEEKELGVDYTARPGCTIIEFTPKLLRELSVGVHTIDFVFTDGVLSTTLEVTAPKATQEEKKTQEETPTVVPTEAPEKKAEETKQKAETGDKNTPNTGDGSSMLLWVVAAMIALLGVGMPLAYRKNAGKAGRR